MYYELSSFGSFYRLRVDFDETEMRRELRNVSDGWRPYNSSKPHMKRYGLSLLSFEGEDDGIRDLDSITEYNKIHGTELHEMAFRTPTRFWHMLPSITKKLAPFEDMMGRTHLIKFDEGGYFPPHRDMGNSFRLVSFLASPSDGLYVILDDRKVSYQTNCLYFMDTRLSHSVFNMMPEAMVMVINLEISERAVKTVKRLLGET